MPVGDRCQICEVKTTPQACFPPISPPTGGREALYQSQARTCSGNDAELIAFNPDAADNLEASSLRQRRAESMQARERGKQKDRREERRKESGKDRRQTEKVERGGRSRSKRVAVTSCKSWGGGSSFFTRFFIGLYHLEEQNTVPSVHSVCKSLPKCIQIILARKTGQDRSFMIHNASIYSRHIKTHTCRFDNHDAVKSCVQHTPRTEASINLYRLRQAGAAPLARN